MISIIIPVYNGARYLKRCMNSVLQQSYKRLEIIIVNDGSTDRSLSILKKYANRDKRVKIINKEQNEGVEKARIDGIDMATGNFIFL